MPRAKRVPSTPARQQFESMWAAVAGRPLEFTLADWDPDTAIVLQALQEVLASGASVFMRPGGGGSTMGIAIWEGDNRYPATWFTEADELNAWAGRIIEVATADRAGRLGENGA